MKKLFLGLFSLLLIAGTMTAQTPAKAYKSAKKAWGKYAVAGEGKDAILEEAKTAIDEATAGISSFEAKELPKVWNLKGEIYNELAGNDAKNKYVNADYTIKYPDAALKAYEAYKNLKESAQKKYQRNDAVAGLVIASTNLSNSGRWMYGDKNYEAAYAAFAAVKDAKMICDEAGKKEILNTPELMYEHEFMTGLAAYQAGNMTDAEKIMTDLSKTEYKEAAVYEILYSVKDKNGDETAIDVLTEGRAKYPEDEGLAIKEINHYLKLEKLDELVGKLQDAINKTPDNISLYLTLGNVYDNLYQREQEAGNLDAAQVNFDNAMKYYRQGLDKDPSNLSATYSIGALYYNKAALMTKELIALEGDYTKSGLKKYDEKKKEVYAAFDEALPYFISAEKKDPNDVGTLTALKEIYAKKDMMEEYTVFKDRLTKVQGGEKLDSSYFNK